MHQTLSFDQVHFIVLQRDVLEFPLDTRLLVRQLTLKADIFALVYDTALQKLQYSNLSSCLTESFQQKIDKVEVAKIYTNGNQETKGGSSVLTFVKKKKKKRQMMGQVFKHHVANNLR